MPELRKLVPAYALKPMPELRKLVPAYALKPILRSQFHAAGRLRLSLLHLPFRGRADQLEMIFHADLMEDVHLVPPEWSARKPSARGQSP